MKLPRDIPGVELATALRKLDYVVTRQKGSHLRVTTQLEGEHHETIPTHSPLKVGTLRAIRGSVAGHHGMTLEELREAINI